MRVLVACESSGVVRDAFRALGHNAWSCDLLPSDSPYHLQGDVLQYLTDNWNMLIAHPPCTYLTSSAEWAYSDGPYHQKVKADTLTGAARRAARDQAEEFFMEMANAPIRHICIENPVGVMSTRWRKADQYIQPYDYGSDASKKTGLWLKNLPLLVADPADRISGRLVDGKERWANQTNSGQNRLPPSANRWQVRSETYSGIATQMAQQWSN